MRIAVTTPTGNVGQHVVRLLVRAGVRPTVLLRDPHRLDPELSSLVDAIQVDQGDADAVVASTAGVDALYWVNPPSDTDDPIAAYARFGAIAAQAVTANGIPRVVFQSSVGAEKRHGAGEIDGLARTEELLDLTGASVTHLRCGYFFTNLFLQREDIRAGRVQVIIPVDHPMPWVAPRDIAETAALRLLSADWSGRNLQAVHGPEDLTWEQVAAIISAATGRELQVERVPDDQVRSSLASIGMGDAMIESIMGMSTGLRDDFVPEQPRSVASTTPTTLASWAYEVLRPGL